MVKKVFMFVRPVVGFFCVCAQKDGEKDERRKREEDRCRTWIKLDQKDGFGYNKRWIKCGGGKKNQRTA